MKLVHIARDMYVIALRSVSKGRCEAAAVGLAPLDSLFPRLLYSLNRARFPQGQADIPR